LLCRIYSSSHEREWEEKGKSTWQIIVDELSALLIQAQVLVVPGVGRSVQSLQQGVHCWSRLSWGRGQMHTLEGRACPEGVYSVSF